MQAILLNNVTTNNWCISRNEPGYVLQGLDAVKQRIAVAFETPTGSNPLKSYYFSELYKWIDKNSLNAVPNIKKILLDIIAIVAPEVTVRKITATETLEGKVTYKVAFEFQGIPDTISISTYNGSLSYEVVKPAIKEAAKPKNVRILPKLQISGVDAMPAPPLFGFTTSEAVANWCNANWSTYGYFGHSDNYVTAFLNDQYAGATFSLEYNPALIIGTSIGSELAIEQEDIKVLAIDLIAGIGTREGYTTIHDDSMSNITFPSFASFFTYFNTDFAQGHSLQGLSGFDNETDILYSNPERFVNATITLDMGVFSNIFNEIFN